MPDEHIDDDEVLYRRVPPGENWGEPPDLTTYNFKLRAGEEGLSVYRAKSVSPQQVLSAPEAVPGSLIVTATASQIRQLVSGDGRPLNLDVVPADPDGNNPGHAEIRGKFTSSVSKQLRDLFNNNWKAGQQDRDESSQS